MTVTRSVFHVAVVRTNVIKERERRKNNAGRRGLSEGDLGVEDGQVANVGSGQCW